MKSNRVIKLSSAIFQLSYVISAIAAFGFTIFYLIGLFIPEWLDSILPYKMPFGILDFPIQMNTGDEFCISAREIVASIKSKGNFPILSYANGFIALLAIYASTYMFHVITVIINGAESNNPFTVEAFTKVKKVGFVFIIIGVLSWIVNVFTQYYLVDLINADSISAMHAELSVEHGVGILFNSLIAPLVIIVVAEVFRQGAKLKEEQDSFI